MWDASLVIPNNIVPPHPALVESLEKFWKCTSNFVAPRIWWKKIVCGPLLTWPTQVSNIFGVGRGPQIYKTWTSNDGDNWGWCCKKWQEHSFVSDNAREAIAENQSARLDELDSIQKRKQLENMYEKCVWLLGDTFNATYAVYLLRAHKCRSPGGVWRPKTSPKNQSGSFVKEL